MNPSPEIHRRLMYILFRALNDARSLALGGRSAQVVELTDAVENLPSYMNNWHDDSLEAIRFQLRNYEGKFPDEVGYSHFLESGPVPERY
ncbi:MAG TPA: hypothetical protein VHR66_17985 [Gemmataceae bacterium]|jgi:hypothetical protein|nr:hypothetical protein [Gemmataceae bacterium]